jgi:hypothetical protein
MAYEKKNPIPTPPVNQARVENTQKARRRREESFDGLDYRLHVPEELKDPRYVYRWINDEPGRIFQLTEQDDYDFVYDERIRSEGKDAHKNTDGGTRISRIVGRSKTGEPLRAYLCRKLKDYYEEDQRKRHDHWQKVTAQVEMGRVPGSSGLFNSDPEHAYIPRDARRR